MRWIEATAVNGSLPVRDGRGEIQSSIALPSGFADSPFLSWLPGAPPLRYRGKEWALLCDFGRFPYTVIALNLTGQSWGARFAWPAEPTTSPEAILQEVHIRGILEAEGGEVRTYGADGLHGLMRAPMKLLSDVSTVAWSPDGLVTAAQDSLMVVTADGTRPLLRSLLRGEYTSEFPRLCSQSAGDGAVWVQYQSETGHGSKLLLRTTRSSVVHELHAGLFHEGFGRRVFDVAHLSKEKYIVATDCCVFVAHLSSESVQEIFAPRMM